MAIGQAVLGAAALDVAELDRLAGLLEADERDRALRHARQLRTILAMHRVHGEAGMELSTVAYAALLMQCSEFRARMLLSDAQVLQRLGALDDMAGGLLTVEQSRVVVDLLGVLPHDGFAASIWERLRDRLIEDQAEEVVRPPARLRELLTRWLIAADPEGFAARRRSAARDEADVELWKRDDGLADLVGRGLSAAEAQACLDRVEQLAQPTGPDDERTTGQRRRDAYRDLLLGRAELPFEERSGAQVFVHVPLAAATGESDEPAELVGHGPIDPEALGELLSAGAVLRRVWVDDNAVPVAVDEQTWARGRDAASLRRALIEIASGPEPLVRHPIHLGGHPPGAGGDPPLPSSRAAPRVLARPHLADPGGYVPPRRLKQLLRVRAPRCEWSGCGRRASRAAAAAAGCDLDHDLAWPYGPTCACNLGPLCRRHHRIKQLGWVKHRLGDGGVRWTDPIGRTWRSPQQHRRTGISGSSLSTGRVGRTVAAAHQPSRKVRAPQGRVIGNTDPG